MSTITILVPCYNEEAVLHIFYQTVKDVIAGIPKYKFEFLFINDGSTDGTLELLRQMAGEAENIQYISLSRNFGKESAMLAGFDHADGDAVIVIDADLQDPPSLIPAMLAEWEKGWQDVYAQRKSRDGETWLKKITSRLYYRILGRLSDVPVLKDVGDFRLLDRQCIEELRRLREHQRYTKGLFCWIGFRKKAILYDRDPRAAGETHWNYWKLTKLAINGITSFSNIPLQMSSWLGAIVSIGAFVYMLEVVIKTLIFGGDVPGYPSLIAVVLFVSGVQLIVLGVIGEYLGKVFTESKRRPVYVISEMSQQEQVSKELYMKGENSYFPG